MANRVPLSSYLGELSLKITVNLVILQAAMTHGMYHCTVSVFVSLLQLYRLSNFISVVKIHQSDFSSIMRKKF